MIAEILPYGKIKSVSDLGKAVRARRIALNLTQTELAALCGVGIRFISELENGKVTLEIGRVLQVLNGLGITMQIQARGWSHQESE